MTASRLFIGIMSGTSLDGIDAALVDFSAARPTLLACHTAAWPAGLQQDLRELAEHSDSLDQCLQLDQRCADCYGEAVEQLLAQAKLTAQAITAIGCHGQTVRHAPGAIPPYTLQIGNPAKIAELTGITTVADFRRRDIAAGGQGAPLAPAFHQAMFHQAGKQRAVVNIGGIANITCLGSEPVIGYDTGPGNRLLDDWIRSRQGQAFDKAGALAAAGQVNEALLETFQADPYFSLPPPKSTGSDYFNLQWLEARLMNFQPISEADVQATLAMLTAWSIATAIQQSSPVYQDVLVCGGGAHNQHLMQLLQQLLPNGPVQSTAAVGVDPDWVEAIAFAWLADRTLQGQPGNLPSVTGASGNRVLGAIHPA